MTFKPHLAIAMRPQLRPLLFDAAALAELGELTHADTGVVLTGFGHSSLRDTEILLTGWDCPPLTAEVLAHAPNLMAVIHAGGSVKHHVTQACWDRGIHVSSAAAVNAIPVAEYTVAAIIMANKRLTALQDAYRAARTDRDWLDWTNLFPSMGNYRKTVGIVGCSRVGRKVIEMLAGFDFQILVHDPFLSGEEAHALGAIPATLDDLVASSDVVSLHAPATEQTRHLMDARRLGLMRVGATLINTARGSLVDTNALIHEVRSGRIYAVLDVTEPEILSADSPLFDLPNVLLTPHVAGSLGTELLRVGNAAVQEVRRFTLGQPLAYPVFEQQLAMLA